MKSKKKKESVIVWSLSHRGNVSIKIILENMNLITNDCDHAIISLWNNDSSVQKVYDRFLIDRNKFQKKTGCKLNSDDIVCKISSDFWLMLADLGEDRGIEDYFCHLLVNSDGRTRVAWFDAIGDPIFVEGIDERNVEKFASITRMHLKKLHRSLKSDKRLTRA